MIQNYQDVMAICRWAGYPDVFITFTCNSKWPEIYKFVHKLALRPEERLDIITRIFKIKLDQFVRDLKTDQIYGKVKASKFFVKQWF